MDGPNLGEQWRAGPYQALIPLCHYRELSWECQSEEKMLEQGEKELCSSATLGPVETLKVTSKSLQAGKQLNASHAAM